MKNLIRIIKLFILTCCGLAATAAFGATEIWTGGVGGVTNNGIDIGYSNNWGGILPSTANNDTAEWDATVPGNLALVYNTVSLASGPGGSGVNLYVNAAHTGSVGINTTLTSTPTIAIDNITIDAGAGAFTFGGTDSAHPMNWVGRPSGAIHGMINNAVSTATLTPWIVFTAGGGSQYEFDFSGTGNWEIDCFLQNNNGSGGTLVNVEGPGTVTWNPGGFLGSDAISSPITINGGTLVLENSHPRLGSQAIALGGTFIFAPTNAATVQTLSGSISGAGTNRISSGTLTLSGQSSYTGDTILAGGELIVNSAETPGSFTGPLGTGPIDFLGGTLGYSVNNVFDYSGRFSTAAGQAYNIDTAGQNVTFTNATGLSGTGNTLTKLGAGTLTLAAASTYTGATTVSAGKLIFQGTKSGSANITVADGAALGATSGAQLAPASLTVGSASGATLEFNNVTSQTTPLIAAGTIAAAGTITINVNNGPLQPGKSYPLISWTSGSAPTVTLGLLNGFIGNLTTDTVNKQIVLNVTATAFTWTGNNNANWDITTANNWVQNGGPVVFANGGPALMDDTGIITNVVVNSLVQPSSITINNNTVAYTIASSGANNIGGSGSLIKSGNSTLSLSGGANTYTGSTTISGGMLSVSNLVNGGAASDIGASANSAANIVINGGTLQYTGTNTSSDHAFSVGLSGATVDGSGFDPNLSVPNSLNLTATTLGFSGNGPRTLALTGTGVSNVLAAVIANNGGATALLKNGPGSWVLTGNNTFTGLTTINNGVLQLGAGGATGSLGTGTVLNDRGLDVNRTGTVTVGAISGTGSVTNDGTGTLVLSGNNTYTGGTAINAGTVQIGSGGASGNLDGNSSITNNGTLIFNTTGNVVLKQFGSTITGTGNVWVRSTGLIEASSANTYTGWVLVDAGATFQPSDGNSGQLLSSVVTNNGTLFFTRQDNNVFGYTNNIVGTGRVIKENNNSNPGDISFIGTNTYTGATVIKGGGIIFGDGVTPGGGSFIGGILFSNTATSFLLHRFVVFHRPDDFTFTNNILSFVTDGSAAGDQGELVQVGPNTLTITGSNNYPGNTTVGGGTLIVGNGGTKGNTGGGNITLTNGGTIVFNHSDTVTITRVIQDGTANGLGTGQFVQMGSGSTILTGTNTSTGSTTVSNGILAAVQVGGDMNVNGGTLAAGGLGAVGNLAVLGNMNFTNGFTQITVDPSMVQSNSTIQVAGSINYIGGSFKVVDMGPALVVGQQFTIFNQAIPAAGSAPIVASGYTFANHLALDGSIVVTAVVPVTAPKFNHITLSGTNVVITATNNAGTGGGTWTLRSTNNVAAPLANWPIIGTGSFDSTGNIAITNGVKAGQQFFILSVP